MNKEIKNISILGSTGSIGYQTVDVIKQSGDNFNIKYLTVNSRFDLLEKQISEVKTENVVLTDPEAYKKFKETTSFKGNILFGDEGLAQAATDDEVEIVLTALVGFSGVKPTYLAVKKGKTIALANKETLVSAGKLITQLAKENNSNIIAVDSEHSAILQCLTGESKNDIEKIILTASGGPFRTWDRDKFPTITIQDALNHPNWTMGSKITIDSASMMNKGLEVIEAFWLFDVEINQIDILVHPQSIIHSMVQFNDGSIKAQLGLPDMRLPISYALNFPNHEKYDFPRMDFNKYSTLTFEPVDSIKFPCINLAFKALSTGGLAPAILNAANEIAVENFLAGKITFNQIAQLIEKSLSKIDSKSEYSLEEVIEKDLETRQYTRSLI